MRQFAITYKKLDDTIHTEKFHGVFLIEALEAFMSSKPWFVKEIISAKEYVTPYKMIIQYEDEPVYDYYYDTFEELMNAACKAKAFDDCSPAINRFVVMANGVLLTYYGWLPNMRMVFTSTETGEVVWDECYPNWDH